MVRLHRESGARGPRPTAPLKLVAAAFVVVCIVGTATALDWNVGTKRISIPGNNADSGTAIVPTAVVVNYGDTLYTIAVRNGTTVNAQDNNTLFLHAWFAM